jgi:hypothetical protein
VPALSTESAKPSSASNGKAKVANTRGPRKTKNPLSITNDTDNNVITITYDPTIDLSGEHKTKAPKAPKGPTGPKAPKAPKATKKENAAASAAVEATATLVTTNE